ncbi:MAG TPA: metallophosphoesterase [Abditibacteriaceae bacterium]
MNESEKAAPDFKGQLEGYAGLGLGITFGAGVALVAHTLWIILAGPTAEFLSEKVKQDGKQETPSDDKTNTASGSLPELETPEVGGVPGIYRVLISDLHIDTWEKEPQRARAFIDFLDALKRRKGEVEIYINGDLLDLPLHAAHEKGREEPLILKVKSAQWEGVFPTQPTYLDQLLMKLREIMDKPDLKIYYLTGNHDVGISGLRYFRPKASRVKGGAQLLDLPAHGIWNPAFIIETGEKWVYIEHGHIHDPLLWIYMRYAIFDLLRGGTRRQERRLARSLQRKKEPGQDCTAGSIKSTTPDHEEEGFRKFANDLVRHRFRCAARRTLRRLRKSGKPVHTVIFGHTHMEERCTMKVARFLNFGNYEGEYINAGSWAGNQKKQTYWLIEPDGNVRGPFEWPQRK